MLGHRSVPSDVVFLLAMGHGRQQILSFQITGFPGILPAPNLMLDLWPMEIHARLARI